MELTFILSKTSNYLKFSRFYYGKNLYWGDAIELFDDEDFVKSLVTIINTKTIENNYKSYFFECPKMNDALSKNKLFEFVLYDAKNNFENKKADPTFFEQYFLKEKNICNVKSNSGNILLIPKLLTKNCTYLNLTNFLHYGDEQQIYELFKEIKNVTQKLLKENKTFWLNTHGLGVFWLHIRIDFTPMYYHHKVYTS